MWKPVSLQEWKLNADQAFWAPYVRKRSDRAKSQMVRKQFESLNRENSATALEFAVQLANKDGETDTIRSQCLLYLAEGALAENQIDSAIEYAAQCSKLNNAKGLSLLVELICQYDRRDRASEAEAIINNIVLSEYSMAKTDRQLYLAVIVAMTGQTQKAQKLANQVFDDRASSNLYSLVRTSQYRAIDRAIFSLVHRGGAIRFLGLLGDHTRCTPQQLAHQLNITVYFNQSSLEPSRDDHCLPSIGLRSAFDHRLIVHLNEFSLDFRWSNDRHVIQQVQKRYDSFKYDDRRHIPKPPDLIQQALIILAIGDDTSIPDVVNPLIELVEVLDAFDECIFYERIGPLSRRHQPEFEPLTVAQLDKLIRARLKPLFVQAGFEKCTTRRFVLTQGPLGYAAGVFLKVDPEHLRISAQLQIYYRDLLEDNALQRYYNDRHEFQPKSFLISPHQYRSQFAEWKPEEPSREHVEQMLTDILKTMRAEWLPIVERTRNPAQELRWIANHIDDARRDRALPSKNRFGATSKLELAVEMAQLLQDQALQAELSKYLATPEASSPPPGLSP